MGCFYHKEGMGKESVVADASALRRYTANAHYAGSGFDLVTALNVKNEWERALGVPVSGPQERVYDAGSYDSQKRIREPGKLAVWIDTVCDSSAMGVSLLKGSTTQS